MPYYEYKCSCGHNFEQRKAAQERQFAQCPVCGKTVEKKMSLANFTFGFRLTDESHNVKWHQDEFERAV